MILNIHHDNKSKQTRIRRPLLAGEWRLIHQFARRVHSFTVNGSELDIIDNHVMQALMSAPSPTSIPLSKLSY
ncbi:hypothetical protein BDR03DRAFT_972029 [Suillus americanus]|nr:hypothetical protein BDR03DRAFT_972029 [Suillus americanus]